MTPRDEAANVHMQGVAEKTSRGINPRRTFEAGWDAAMAYREPAAKPNPTEGN